MTDHQLRRLYEIRQARKLLEEEEAGLKDALVRAHGTGRKHFGAWILTIASFTQYRFSRQDAEAELGDLSRFEKPSASLRVDVQPNPTAILEAV